MRSLLRSSRPAAGERSEAPAGRELLNSERIEQRFGSYGIEVLESGAAYRVSNLYSLEGAQKICRTFAVVRYPETVAPEFALEHQRILAGGSIGAVFSAAGWRVEKRHLYFGTLTATRRVAELMGIVAGTALATHVYVLDVVKDDHRFQYAAIVEIHHPDYLRAADLPAIYGPADPAGRTELVTTMLTVAKAKMSD